MEIWHEIPEYKTGYSLRVTQIWIDNSINIVDILREWLA